MLRFAMIAALSVVICSEQGNAGVLRFDQDWQTASYPRAEEGFNFQDSLAYYDAKRLYLHDDSGVTSSTFTRSDGNLFNMLSGTVSPYSLLYEVMAGPNPDGVGTLESTHDSGTVHLKPIPLKYSFSGYRNGALVANLDQLAVGFPIVTTVQNWGTIFSNLDTFKVSLLYPEDRVMYALDQQHFDRLLSPKAAGTIVCREWCGALRLDDLSYSLVAPVPVPPALPLLIAGVTALWYAGRKRRREGMSTLSA